MKCSRSMLRAGVIAGLLVLASVVTGTASGAPNDALVKKLKDNARGSVSISVRAGTGAAGFVKAGQNGDLLPAEKSAPKGKALGFWKQYGQILGVGDESTLDEISSVTDAYGATHITYQQLYKGIPVFGGLLKAHVDKDGNLTGVNGVGVPDIALDTTAKLSPAQAADRAIAEVVADPPVDETGHADKLTAGELSAASTTLYVYRMGLVRGVAGSSQLAYQVEVTNGSDVREFVFVHAQAGKSVNRYSAASDALHRVVYEKEFTPAAKIWEEGDAFPGLLNVDQQNIVNFSGEAYGFFFNTFGRDSYDGAGHTMSTVNNDPRISCPNANWNGITTNYCNGVTSDDVVAHEWGHAYTEFTHGLIYQWQPGALNESYSDIWGETIDQINGVQTDSPATIRTPGVCSSHTTPPPILIINAPTPGSCAAGAAQFGAPLTATGVTGDVVLADDGVADPSTSNGCTALVNAAQVAGKIALIDRGICGFAVKVKIAQNAGAIAVVIANNAAGVVTMAGSDATITIPSLSISLQNGNLLKGYLANGQTPNVTLKLAGAAAPPEDSYKWLLSEDSTAFNPVAPPGGHAIRDMWDPTCLADPGKVTDAEYQCDTSDAGGVHTNSGVSNHAYALLVDGGVYNGTTVMGIGLTKAAHIYWRAQSVYQTPTTDFADHADALDASCQDLIGQPLAALRLTAPAASADVISQGDCNQVAAVNDAVAFRHDPTQQCGFKPLLDPNTPQLCPGAQKNPSSVYSEDFEDGLDGWSLSNQGVYSGWEGTNWVATGSLPGGRGGSAAFAEELDGQCDNGAGDRSGVMRLISPAITLPNAAIQSPRLTFQHYVASELAFDGGNVKISVNGGAFTIVPKTAFLFNGYNGTLEPATTGNPPVPRNTNPLAGQEAFSGTDGGLVTGTWAQSQIDLTKVGVKPGDTIQLRFDFGMDGCGAIDGWYVDDVKVQACNTKKAPAAASASVAETVYRRD